MRRVLRLFSLGSLLAALGFGSVLAEAGELAKVRAMFGSQSRAPSTVSPYSIAKKMGYFAEEGIEAEYLSSDGSVQATQLVSAGQAEYGVPSPEGTLNAAGRGTDLGTIYVYMAYRQPIFGLAVKPDSPVRSPRDLKGKTIGVASMGSSGVPAAKSMFREAGLDPEKDATFVAVGIGAVAGRALEDGRVDALSLWDEQYAILETLGIKFRELPFTETYRKLFSAGILVRREYLAKNRSQVVGFARAFAKAQMFGMANPEAAVKINWEVFPESKPKGVDEARALRDGTFVFKRRAAKWDPSLGGDSRMGAMTAEEWKAWVPFLGLEGKIDIAKYYTAELIDEINRFDRNKVLDQARTYR